MKKKLFIPMATAALLFAVCGCINDDDGLSAANIPQAVAKAYSDMYPEGGTAEWTYKNGVYRATNVQQGEKKKTFISPAGTWIKTKTEWKKNSAALLPQPIRDYIDANHAGSVIDEIEYIQTGRHGNFFEIELEKHGAPDVEILIREDGSVIRIVTDNLEDDDDFDDDKIWRDHFAQNQERLQAAIKTFREMYPDAHVEEWEVKYGYAEVDFILGNKEYEARYSIADGTWMRTKTAYRAALPQAIRHYIDVHYAGYSIDDVDFIETPAGSYYEIELEKQGQPDVEILLREDGTLLK